LKFRASQTFLYPLNDDNQCEHLWIVATEPNSAGLFAIASFTSLKGAKDQTVILRKDEHPFLKWDTCISYAQAEIMSVGQLEGYIRCGRARLHQNATPELFQLVLAGFNASGATKNRVRNFIREVRGN
jgi:hypothetical protein